MERIWQVSLNTKVFPDKVLGRGSFGTVYRGQYLEQRHGKVLDCAIKFNDSQEELLQNYFKKECEISMNTQHKNLISSYESGVFRKRMYLVLEYAPNGSLFDYLSRLDSKKMAEYEAKVVAGDILEGLAFLHDQGIIHRDLKLENILLSKNMTVKIADFGFAKKRRADGVSQQTILGTPSYVAPEIAQQSSYNSKVDIFAYGMLVYALVYGDVVNPKAEFNTNLEFSIDKISWPETFSNELISFLRACLHQDPNQRADCKSLMKHPWLASMHIASEVRADAAKLKNQSSKIFNQMIARDKNKLRTLQDKVYKQFEFKLKVHLESLVRNFLKIGQDINANIERNEPDIIAIKNTDEIKKQFTYLKLALDFLTIIIFNSYRNLTWNKSGKQLYLDLTSYSIWFKNKWFEEIYKQKDSIIKSVIKKTVIFSKFLSITEDLYTQLAHHAKTKLQTEWIDQLKHDFYKLKGYISGVKIEYGVQETGPNNIEGVSISAEEWTRIRQAVLVRIETDPIFTIDDPLMNLTDSEPSSTGIEDLNKFLKVRVDLVPNL
jgi:serine/threonine protein kinase